MNDEILNQAIALTQAGQKIEARQILRPLIKAEPRNVPVWLLYIEACSTDRERAEALELCFHFNPGNAQVQQILETLHQQHKRPTNGTRLMWVLAGVLVILFGMLIVNFEMSRPEDPTSHRHAQPGEYYLYVPKAYISERAWPLFIGIHGFGGSGLDCWNLWQPYAERQGFILLCPTLSDPGGGWYQSDGEQRLWAMINQVGKDYHFSPRYFLVGFSAGAQFVQGFAFNYPQAVQAVAVLSAGNYYPPVRQAGGIPFLVVIGDRDDPAAINNSMQFADALSQNTSTVNYWLLPGVGHEITDKSRQLTIDFFAQVNGR